MIVDLLLVIKTPATHFIIYVDSQGGYHRGTLQPFTYIVAIYYLIFGIVYAMGNRSMLSRQVVTSITAFISMTVVAVIVQMINKLLLVECFAASDNVHFAKSGRYDRPRNENAQLEQLCQ